MLCNFDIDFPALLDEPPEDYSHDAATQYQLEQNMIQTFMICFLFIFGLYWFIQSMFRSIDNDINDMKAGGNTTIKLILSLVPDALILAYGIERGFRQIPEKIDVQTKTWVRALSLISDNRGDVVYANKKAAAELMRNDTAIRVREKELCQYHGSAIMVNPKKIESDLEEFTKENDPIKKIDALSKLLGAREIAVHDHSDQLSILEELNKKFEKSPVNIKCIAPDTDLTTLLLSEESSVAAFIGSITDRVTAEKIGMGLLLDHRQLARTLEVEEANVFVYRMDRENLEHTVVMQDAIEQLEALWVDTVRHLKSKRERERFKDFLNKKIDAEISETVRLKLPEKEIFTDNDIDSVLDDWFAFPNMDDNDTLLTSYF